ncbi:CPBP family intramembrane glutamic endopeptidase [Halorarius halobius]|uniref:CPBP family intramembrane glutamic endopeptidase n=1 Tax=Halorarius halobius TaxID=2962671 RepID=UPI0020CCBD08|nr:CPBP family intramembrane glutamic endopeptidase [Halorarius halobius]
MQLPGGEPTGKRLLATALVITIALWGWLTGWSFVFGSVPGREPLVLADQPVVRDVAYQLLRALFAVGVAAAVVRHFGIESPLAWLGVSRPAGREWGYLPLGIVLLIVTLLGAQVLLMGVLGFERTPSQSLADPVMLSRLLTLLVLVGPAEELIFRGTVQQSLGDRFGEWPAILIAATLFGFGHVSLWATAPGDLLWLVAQTGAGVVLGWVYYRTDNLVVTALTHGGFVSLTTALAVM